MKKIILFIATISTLSANANMESVAQVSGKCKANIISQVDYHLTKRSIHFSTKIEQAGSNIQILNPVAVFKMNYTENITEGQCGGDVVIYILPLKLIEKGSVLEATECKVQHIATGNRRCAD